MKPDFLPDIITDERMTYLRSLQTDEQLLAFAFEDGIERVWKRCGWQKMDLGTDGCN